MKPEPGLRTITPVQEDWLELPATNEHTDQGRVILFQEQRQAFEAALRAGCQHNNVPVAFQQNTKDVKAEVLLKAVEDWSKVDRARKLRFEPVLKRLRLLRNVVLNRYSHPLAPNIPTTEVHTAITEVEKLIDAFVGKP